MRIFIPERNPLVYQNNNRRVVTKFAWWPVFTNDRWLCWFRTLYAVELGTFVGGSAGCSYSWTRVKLFRWKKLAIERAKQPTV